MDPKLDSFVWKGFVGILVLGILLGLVGFLVRRRCLGF